MGVLKRLLIPRSVRRAAHPVRTVRRAVTPKPIKKLKRSVYVATNPLGALEGAAENAAVRALRPKKSRAKSRSSAASGASRQSASKTRDVGKSEKRTTCRATSTGTAVTKEAAPQAAYGWLAILSTGIIIVGAVSRWPVVIDAILVTTCIAFGVPYVRRNRRDGSTAAVINPPPAVERKATVFRWSGDRVIEYRIGVLPQTRIDAQRRVDVMLQQRIEEDLRPLKNDGWVLDGSFPDAVHFAHDSRATLLGRKRTYRGATVQVRRET
jgi:hypothetical protein